jgi:hypothetical protein
LPKQKHKVPTLLDVRNSIGRVINGTMSVTDIKDAIKELKAGFLKYTLLKGHSHRFSRFFLFFTMHN